MKRLQLLPLCVGFGFLAAATAAAADGAFDQQLSLRTMSAFAQNPQDSDLFPSDSESDQQVMLRESIKYQATKNLRFELNIYNLIIGATDKTSLVQTLFNASDETNRTPNLERHWRNSQVLDAYLTVDRINLKAKVAGTDVTIGRFPINMSTMFIFTPNDFFAPFRPFEYYREYKPGVDAVRIDHGLGKTGQISVMGVAGYQTPLLTSRVNSANAASSSYSPLASSALARASYTLGSFEGALLGGKLGAANMGGFTLQGELGPVGIRAEGNQRINRLTQQAFSEVAGGLDYRLTTKLVMQLEQFFNGQGYGNTADYTKSQGNSSATGLLLGRNYTGIGGLYALTGLTNLKGLVLVNESDQSVLGSVDFIYSVAPNAQLVISLLSPHGKGPHGLAPQSEFGSYPGVLSVQTGVYF